MLGLQASAVRHKAAQGMQPAKEPLLVPSSSLPSRNDVQARVLQFAQTYTKQARRGEAPEAMTAWDERLEAVRPVLEQISGPLFVVASWYWWAFCQLKAIYDVLPTNVIQMVFGLALCFFGGTYTVSIAAIEAFRQMGGAHVWTDLGVLAEQAKLVGAASQRDDARDDDRDGVKDVEQMLTKDLVERKFKLGMATVQEPERVVSAMGSLWSAYLAILATLRLEFARTTALALGIAEVLEFPALRVMAPLLTAAYGPDLAHWVKTSVSIGVKVFAMMFAWYMQMVISAWYSAIRGGFMFATGLFSLLVESGWVALLPDFLVEQKDENGWRKPFNPDESYLDEAVAYPTMALGLYFQLANGFTLPFPLDLIFLPLSIVEWVLRWQVTWGI